LGAGDLTYLTNGLMKLEERLVQILSEDEKLRRGKSFLFPQSVDRYSDERYSENLRTC